MPCEAGYRRFDSLSSATKKSERRYKSRADAERVNFWLKIFVRADDKSGIGCRHFFALLGVILEIPTAFVQAQTSFRHRLRSGTLRKTVMNRQ